MDDFIQSVSSSLGIDAGTAKSATSGLLETIKENADGADFQTLVDKIPGASDLLGSSGDGGGGGLLGGLGNALGGVMGGGLGKVLASGLGPDQLGDFVSQFVEWIKGKLDADTVNRLLGSVPGLGDLLG